MNVVVPMAGRGSRLADHFTLPKPLVNVHGRPMVAWALDSLVNLDITKWIFVVLSDHQDQYNIASTLKQYAPDDSEIILLDKITEGQLCTALAARELINSSDDLLIANSDTFITSNLASDIANRPDDCRGLISVANLPGDQWSFARTDGGTRVVEVAEKVRISDHASTGLYYFSNGLEFLDTADEMIRNHEKVRGEYYVIPLYKKYIDRGFRVDISQAEEVWDMGNPDALSVFEKYLTAKEAM